VILVAVGTQFPFDRLVKTVDEWAANEASEVIAQIGRSSYVPANIEARPFWPPREFQTLLERSHLIVAHCGMGSILTALSHGKRIIVMPRSAAKGEHRNDHQFATAHRFSDRAGVAVAWDEVELRNCLDRVAGHDPDSGRVSPIPSKAPRQLTDRLRDFLCDGKG
jgi:UDP-N-acetylglucosamine transferase subunit ALG13